MKIVPDEQAETEKKALEDLGYTVVEITTFNANGRPPDVPTPKAD